MSHKEGIKIPLSQPYCPRHQLIGMDGVAGAPHSNANENFSWKKSTQAPGGRINKPEAKYLKNERSHREIRKKRSL